MEDQVSYLVNSIWRRGEHIIYLFLVLLLRNTRSIEVIENSNKKKEERNKAREEMNELREGEGDERVFVSGACTYISKKKGKRIQKKKKGKKEAIGRQEHVPTVRADGAPPSRAVVDT